MGYEGLGHSPQVRQHRRLGSPEKPPEVQADTGEASDTPHPKPRVRKHFTQRQRAHSLAQVTSLFSLVHCTFTFVCITVLTTATYFFNHPNVFRDFHALINGKRQKN